MTHLNFVKKHSQFFFNRRRIVNEFSGLSSLFSLLPSYLFLVLIFPFFLSSCSYFKKKFIGEDELPLARANQVYLYPSDVEGLTKGLHGEDSIKLLKAYADKWVRQQMLLQKANENIPSDDPGIMKKIEDYRQQLTLYEYEKALIADKLDTTIRTAEIEKYYEDFSKNIPLQNDVHLVQFIRLKEEAPDFKDIKKLILSSSKSEEDEQRIEGYSKANAGTYAYANPLWYNTENLQSVFSFNDKEIAGVLQTNKFKEFKHDDGTSLFIRVNSTKRKGEPMPLELARTDISKILIEKRKMKLIEQTYERVFRDGVNSKTAEVYVK
jgi:hypothetical protein